MVILSLENNAATMLNVIFKQLLSYVFDELHSEEILQ